MRVVPVLIALILFVVPSGFLSALAESPSSGLTTSSIGIDMSTFFGGSGEDTASNVRFDSDGNIIIVGNTLSNDLAVSNAHQETYGGGRDAFILKIDNSYNVLFCTYYGGSGEEYAEAVVTDEENNIIITGHTESDNLQVPNGLQTELRGVSDAYVAKFSPTGTLLYGSYIGGNGNDEWITSIELDGNDNWIMAGPFDSDDLNTTSNAYQESFGGGDRDIVVFSLTPDGQSIVFMTYFGLDDHENCAGFTLDSQDNIVMTGYTINGGITTEGAYQESYGGGDGDVFVSKLSSDGQSLLWSTFLGGSQWDFGGDVRVDTDGTVVVSGYSESPDFPLQNELFGNDVEQDTFLSRLSEDGSELLFSTLLGGDGEDRCYGMTMLDNSSVATCSFTTSSNMPTVGAWQENNSGSYDAYFALYDSSLDSLLCASYIGGSGSDMGFSIDTYNDEYIALVGRTSSNNFPTANPIQSERSGSYDSFIVILRPSLDETTPPPSEFPLDLLIGGIATLAIVIVIVAFVYIKKRG